MLKWSWIVLFAALTFIGCGGSGGGGANGPADGDFDGYSIAVDCDDANAAVHTGASETCDGLDNDCDPATADGSGESAPLNTLQAGVCADSVRVCSDGTWQDSYTQVVGYAAPETVCDGLDSDCDGSLDESCASGDCIGCHSSRQDDGDGLPSGGRRGAAAEFPAGDAHAHYGATLGAEDCLVCHDESSHGNGSVDLAGPDGGQGYHFAVPSDLSSDPDLSDFCMACHDADGATRSASPADPFGNGNAPPGVAVRFTGSLRWNEWYGDLCYGEEGTNRGVNSHHDIRDADQTFSGAKIECLDCHNAHTASASRPLVDPFAKSSPWSGSGNQFCLACHAGGTPGAPGLPPGVAAPTIPPRPLQSCDYTSAPWWTNYTWTHSAHGLNSKRGWTGYSGAPVYELPCLGCHDAHGSVSPANPAGNPYMIRDHVDGRPYIDDGVREGPHWTGPPWNTTGTARDVVIGIDGLSVGWGNLCVACHADWLAASYTHDMCGGCQTCHAHGMDFNEADWASPLSGNNTGCFSCGNGVIDALEECDDGNRMDGDGCSNECVAE